MPAAPAVSAHRRGLRLIWRGDVRHMPAPAPTARCLLNLQPEDAAAAAGRAAAKRQPHAPSTAFLRSPVQPGTITKTSPAPP
jgi:hypothetical protein